VTRMSYTEFAVLGLLMRGPRSGYDLNKLANDTIAYFWKPARSKIYSSLRRLVEEGLVTGEKVVQDTRPDKQVYRITPAGKKRLRSWLDAEEIVAAPGRHGLLLKLFFGEYADQKAIRGHILRWKQRAEEQLAAFEEIERGVDKETNLFPYLTLRHGIEDARSTVEWTEEVLATLDQRTRLRS
jgi:PadR family transcriptional regulator, regulatory protein AphA